jgi:hypothetical protein
MLNILNRLFSSTDILIVCISVFSIIVLVLEYFGNKTNSKKKLNLKLRLIILIVLAVITALISITNSKDQKETNKKIAILVQTCSSISTETETIKTTLSFVKTKIVQVDSLAKIKNNNSKVNTQYNVLINNIENSLTIIEKLNSDNILNLQILNSISDKNQNEINLDTTIIQRPVLPDTKYIDTIKELQDIKDSLKQIHKEIQDIKEYNQRFTPGILG